MVADHDDNIEFFNLWSRNIATYVGLGKRAWESPGRACSLAPQVRRRKAWRGIFPATCHFAGASDSARGVHALNGKVIVPSYPPAMAKRLADYEAQPGSIVHVEGAVKTAL
ncbi:hypothetical protein [Nocardiopsis synnemataformans]|uniref:hypothetical protein n=1 Tax=Nocardiopsis synnemataformans TaxID=61305 RepID=UPI003EC06112